MLFRSSRALQDMRAILGVLRDDNDGRAPHPGLGEIDELTTKAREAGLDVDLEAISPPPLVVPSAVGSAVYRIVQESMTNVIRHVGPTRVTVALDFGTDSVEICVTDEGRREGSDIAEAALRPGADRAKGGLADPGKPGRGILGMRERCQLLGGELDAGPLPGGGFAVTARLPMTATGTANL